MLEKMIQIEFYEALIIHACGTYQTLMTNVFAG